MFSIYALHVPGGEYRYIGQTNNMRSRRSGHKCDANRSKDLPVCRWVKKHIDEFQMTVIDVCETRKQADALEEYWIAEYRAAGYALLNLTNGGGGTSGYVWTDEHREEQSQRMMGNTLMRGTVASTETRAKQSAAGLGRKHSPEWIKNSADGLRGRTQSEEARENMRVAQLQSKEDANVKAKQKLIERFPVGTVIGHWTILGEPIRTDFGRNGKRGNRAFVCRCDCGNVRVVRIPILKEDNYGCGKCARNQGR